MSKIRFLGMLCAIVTTLLSYPGVAEERKPLAMIGVNIACSGFAPQHLPGIYKKDYIYPSKADIGMFADIGMNTIRIPFVWERMQPKLNEPLDADELGRLDATVLEAKARHVIVILTPFDSAKYRGLLIGSKEVPTESFTSFWQQLAKHYVHEPFVAFGMMNEPNKHPAEVWAAIAQETILAIRKTGARQLILVPGTIWTGAHSWYKKVGKLSNAEALAGIYDPENNIAIEVHQYFDSDYSGRSPACISETVGADALAGVTSWLRATHHRGILAEVGASKDPVCLAALKNTLTHLQQNADVWLGWTYWAAGVWWTDYMFSIQPPDPVKHPQISILKEFLPNP